MKRTKNQPFTFWPWLGANFITSSILQSKIKSLHNSPLEDKNLVYFMNICDLLQLDFDLKMWKTTAKFITSLMKTHIYKTESDLFFRQKSNQKQFARWKIFFSVFWWVYSRMCFQFSASKTDEPKTKFTIITKKNSCRTPRGQFLTLTLSRLFWDIKRLQPTIIQAN